jgi:hypothetical protein
VIRLDWFENFLLAFLLLLCCHATQICIVFLLRCHHNIITTNDDDTGEPFNMELEKDKLKREATSNASNTSNNTNTNKKTEMTDEELKAKFEKAQKKLGISLTKEQMEALIKDTKHPRKNQQQSKGKEEDEAFQDIEDELDLTLTQKVNLVIYGSMFVGLIYVLNRDYNSVATLWFIRMFPREAKVLGFH